MDIFMLWKPGMLACQHACTNSKEEYLFERKENITNKQKEKQKYKSEPQTTGNKKILLK